MKTTMQQAADAGQSIWLDYILRSFTQSGKLAELIGKGLMGVTSNPSIFEKAIVESKDYASVLDDPANASKQPGEVFEQIAIEDIRAAADAFRPLYDSTKGVHGYVSLEVEPSLAKNETKTASEAKRLWAAAARPNVMIKIPGTPEGLRGIEDSIAAGININVTLLFSVDAYEAAARAYIRGLNTYAKTHADLSRVAGVASFFLSRIDTLADKQLNEKAKAASGIEKDKLEGLRGRAAVANAKIAYERFEKIFSGPEWEALAAKGARKQRVLWASTSTKNPAYNDLMYVEPLIGPDTVNTMPPATLDAFMDHGRVEVTIKDALDEAHQTMQALEAAGVSMKQVTDALLVDGVKQFSDAFVKLIAAVEEHKVKEHA
ncbi:MAG: transaldolase [Acidobacteriaceae bacterium]